MYFDLENKTNEELRDMAKKLDLDVPSALGREKLIDAVDEALLKKQETIKALAVEEVRQKKADELKINKLAKPSPETLAIEKSKKVYCIFLNMESPDSDVRFCIGEKYVFHFYHGKKHVVPEVLISEKRDDAWISRAQRCIRPVYAKKTLPDGRVIDAKIGDERRFIFSAIGPAPDDAPFGAVFEKEPVAATA